jgi:hypothetical protein
MIHSPNIPGIFFERSCQRVIDNKAVEGNDGSLSGSGFRTSEQPGYPRQFS